MRKVVIMILQGSIRTQTALDGLTIISSSCYFLQCRSTCAIIMKVCWQ